VRPQYVALAPGRDAVLKYQERQYQRQNNERNQTGKYNQARDNGTNVVDHSR